jgi:hypothetical protein
MDEVVKMFNEYKEWKKQFRKMKLELFKEAFLDTFKPFWGDLGKTCADYFINEFFGGKTLVDWLIDRGILDPGLRGDTTGNGGGGGHSFGTPEPTYSRSLSGNAISQSIQLEKDTETTAKSTKKMSDTLTDTEKFILRIWEELGSDKFKSTTGVYFGGDLSTLTYKQKQSLYTILKQKGYASGTVIPPSASEFLAKVGDNNRETEVISPLSTIKQALKEALIEAPPARAVFEVVGDSKGLFRIMQREAMDYTERSGNNAFG